MIKYTAPIILIVLSNVMYHIIAKTTPQGANPFLSLFFTYLTAAIVTAMIYFIYPADKSLLANVKEVNWTSFALGIAVIGLEFGYIIAYRVGWNISLGSLTANTLLPLFLIPIGIIFFKEGFSFNKAFGILLCLFGLILINKK